MLGRDEERAALRRLLEDAAADGRGSAVVLRGEAGIGKTTLVEDARTTAATLGFRVLTCAGVQSETRAAMAGLQQLLHVAVDRAGGLPERQRDALRSAFGLGPDTAPDRLLLSVAVLGLLEDLAQERPLLLVLEDLQWMDQPTINMIGFVGRRLRETAIVMVATCRSGGPDPLGSLGLPELWLGRLSTPDAGALLAELNPALRREIRDRVLAEAEGNPLALVELSRGLLDRGLHDAGTLPARLPLSARLENAFAGQVARLPAPTQDLLLLAACSDAARLDEMEAAGRVLGIDFTALAAAEEAGLVHASGSELVFRHPLIQSAIYGAASFPRRIAAHRALAEVLGGTDGTDATDGTTGDDGPESGARAFGIHGRGGPATTGGGADRERAAWHRAAATVGKDETVARELEAAAERALARGATGAAMRTLERAADLSPSPDRQARRLAAAGEAARQAGLTRAALNLTEAAGRVTTDPIVLAGVALTQGMLSMHAGTPAATLPQLFDLALRSAPIDPQITASLLVQIALLCRIELRHPELGPLIERELAALPLDPGDLRVMMAQAAIDPARHADRLLPLVRAATEHLSAMDPLIVAGIAASAEPLHDWGFTSRCWTFVVDGNRRAGTVADLSATLARQARSLVVRGQLADALDSAEDAERLAADLGLPTVAAHAVMVRAHVHAWRGEAAAGASALTRIGELVPAPRAELRTLVSWAGGLAALGEGRHQQARAELTAVVDHPDFGLLAIADLTEAAHREGDAGAVAALVADAERRARPFDAPLLRILLNRSRALLEDGEEHFIAAIGGPGAAIDFPLQVARSRLVYGEWLRRQRRIGPARDELAAAASAFEQAGARPWAARAGAELRASGIAVQRPADAGRAQLTGQELQIARLAATGLSNKEIADQLFLSHRTVGAHLYRIFPKLGISGRAALRDALAELSPGGIAVT